MNKPSLNYIIRTGDLVEAQKWAETASPEALMNAWARVKDKKPRLVTIFHKALKGRGIVR